MASGLLKIKKISCASELLKKFLVDPPAPADRSAGPTRGLQAKTQKPIGSLGHALDFVAIGKLGNALDFRTIGNLSNAMHFVTIGNLGNDLVFVNIGNLGNCFAIAKIANDSGWLHASGGGEGEKPLVIGNIGKIVTRFQLARPYTDSPLQYRINDNIANSPIIVL